MSDDEREIDMGEDGQDDVDVFLTDDEDPPDPDGMSSAVYNKAMLQRIRREQKQSRDMMRYMAARIDTTWTRLQEVDTTILDSERKLLNLQTDMSRTYKLLGQVIH